MKMRLSHMRDSIKMQKKNKTRKLSANRNHKYMKLRNKIARHVSFVKYENKKRRTNRCSHTRTFYCWDIIEASFWCNVLCEGVKKRLCNSTDKKIITICK